MKRWQVFAVAVFETLLMVFGMWIVVRVAKAHNNKPDPVTVTDTIIEWRHDTVYRYDTKIVKLPVHDTTVCTDSVMLTDSVLVEVPILRYHYDTTLTDTTVTTRLQATLSGYDVRIDTLAVTATVQPIIIKENIPWRKRFRPSVGVGIGTTLKGEASVGLFVGVGYLF